MIIGYGWRADFYYRIAKLLPERFSVCAGVLRTEERAKEVAHKEGVFATSDLDPLCSKGCNERLSGKINEKRNSGTLRNTSGKEC